MHTGQSNTHRLRKVHCGKEANRTHTHKQVEGVNWFDTKHTILHPLIHFNQAVHIFLCLLLSKEMGDFKTTDESDENFSLESMLTR